LTGDAGKEKTGLDGRFFCVWGLCFKAEINVLAQNRCFVSVFLAPVTDFIIASGFQAPCEPLRNRTATLHLS